MKAFEVRKEALKNQFNEAMKDIAQAMAGGSTRTIVCLGYQLYPEVAEKIANEGFDVQIVLKPIDCLSYNDVSWFNAEEGKKGTITYVNETMKPSIEEILTEILEKIKTMNTNIEKILTEFHEL